MLNLKTLVRQVRFGKKEAFVPAPEFMTTSFEVGELKVSIQYRDAAELENITAGLAGVVLRELAPYLETSKPPEKNFGNMLGELTRIPN